MENTSDLLVGKVVFLGISLVMTPPRVSSPRERGDTSRSTMSLTSPIRVSTDLNTLEGYVQSSNPTFSSSDATKLQNRTHTRPYAARPYIHSGGTVYWLVVCHATASNNNSVAAKGNSD